VSDYVVIARWRAQVGEEDAVARALAEIVPVARAEPGMVAYQVHRDPADPCVFTIYERYVDAAAYDAHLESEPMQRLGFGDAIPRLASRERELLEIWEP
jgi:(4S)-4-hydroxy-5-phosphonooxypentane-2,3-dione isomerase